MLFLIHYLYTHQFQKPIKLLLNQRFYKIINYHLIYKYIINIDLLVLLKISYIIINDIDML